MIRSSSGSVRWIGALLAVVLLSSIVLAVSAAAATCLERCCECADGGNCCNDGARLVNDDCGVKLDPNPGVESQSSPPIDTMALAESPEELPSPSSWSGEHQTLCDPPATRDDGLYLRCSLLI